jgi:hypothetical protein
MTFFRFFCIFCLGLIPLSSVALQAQCQSNDATAPCFTNNFDILNGRRALIPAQDTAFNGVFNPVQNPGIVSYGVYVLSNTALTSNPSGISGLQPESNPVEISARMFNQTAPQIVSAISTTAGGSANVALETSNLKIPAMQVLEGSNQLYGTANDFLGNGVDQIVIVGLRQDPPGHQIIAFEAIVAQDPNNIGGGFFTGPMSGGVNNASSVLAVTSGVFTDRQVGQPMPKAQIAIVSGNPTTGSGLTLSLYGVSSNLGFPSGPSLNLALPPGVRSIQSLAIAAGRFAGSAHDQLVIAYAAAPGGTAGLITVDFDSNGTPVRKTTYNTNVRMLGYTSGQYGGAVWLAKERFNWFGNTDQVALQVAPGGPQTGTMMQIVSFDQNMNPIPGKPNTAITFGLKCRFGLAAGRFLPDTNSSSSADSTSILPPALINIATDCGTDSSDSGIGMVYYNVAPDYTITAGQFDFSIEFPDNPRVPVTSGTLQTALSVSIGAGDLQGRSLLLGPAEKATVTAHFQPDMVLQMPPMHVDWIPPAGQTQPEILNVSVFPATFNTAYSTQSGQSVSVNRAATTSYTVATKETASEKISYGVPGIANIVVQSAQAATQLHQNSVAKKYNSYAGMTNGFSTKTVFDDIVAATTSSMNIYSYRVIGQCVPSANASASEGCAAGTVPMYVQFSGPDNVTYIQNAEGRNIEWYQPVQEPGNLFSYPANQQQLAENLAGGSTLQLLTPSDNLWGSQSSSSVSANWSSGSGASVESSSLSNHTFDVSTSVSGSVSFDGFGAGASAGFDYNRSASTSTLNQSTSILSQSQGITLNRGVGGGEPSKQDYAYQGSSMIFGQNAPQGTVQSDATPNTTVKTQGFIAAGHVVDVLSTGGITSGNFWPQAYGANPDLALNHPQRWLQKTPSGIHDQLVWFNCPIGYTSSQSSPACTQPSMPVTPTPANVADAVFYQMKGLFVTPGDTFDGPQITETNLGDKVNLRARIYNYSVTNLPANAVVHVQFYAQPWDRGQFASVPGDPSRFKPAVFIGEGTNAQGGSLSPVPAYCGGLTNSGDPCVNSPVQNWEYAYATWDTSKNGVTGGSTWKFWVVVWAEVNGTIVAETPGHGLKSLPAPKTPYNSLADVPIETYSNNLGYYNQEFTVLTPPNISATAIAKTTPILVLSSVALRSGAKAFRDQPAPILAQLRSTGTDIAANVYYYDGNPDSGGELFDIQKIGRIPSGNGYTDKASFTPKTCGPHWIFVRAVPLDGSILEARNLTGIRVTIDPLPEVESLIIYVQGMAAPTGVKQQLLAPLQAARNAYQTGQPILGNIQLDTFRITVQINRAQIPSNALTALIAEFNDIQDCL